MLAQITSKQLTEWMAFYQIEPFGEERDDLRSGIVASVIANVNRGKNRKPFKPEEFMPYRERPNQAKMLRASLGHLVVKKNST
jgi:hypothetical protein